MPCFCVPGSKPADRVQEPVAHLRCGMKIPYSGSVPEPPPNRPPLEAPRVSARPRMCRASISRDEQSRRVCSFRPFRALPDVGSTQGFAFAPPWARAPAAASRLRQFAIRPRTAGARRRWFVEGDQAMLGEMSPRVATRHAESVRHIGFRLSLAAPAGRGAGDALWARWVGVVGRGMGFHGPAVEVGFVFAGSGPFLWSRRGLAA